MLKDEVSTHFNFLMTNHIFHARKFIAIQVRLEVVSECAFP